MGFPSGLRLRKDGTVTNTSGEFQPLHKAAEVMGARSDFDLLRSFRINSKSRASAKHSTTTRRPRLRRNSQSRAGL